MLHRALEEEGKMPSKRREDNIKMTVSEVGWGDMDWIHVAQDRRL
jgi:hypothetical protein